jgi:hypothetical protein
MVGNPGRETWMEVNIKMHFDKIGEQVVGSNHLDRVVTVGGLVTW